MHKVVILQRVACDYQREFFLQLHARLAARGLALAVTGGRPRAAEARADGLAELPFGVRCLNLRLAGKPYWQAGALAAARGADLVVLEQANAALHNYVLLARRRRAPRPRLAFWGHGARLTKAGAQPARDAWKRLWVNRVDWWFAYSERSAAIVAAAGFPRERITVVENAIDTAGLRRERARVGAEDRARLLRELFGADAGGPLRVAVFCSRLTSLKRIPFLLASAERIHHQLPEFRLIVIGDGPDAPAVAGFCRTRPWCARLGSRRGAERVPYLALADVWLNPGAVGLAMVDALGMGLPLATTDVPFHGPELSYLRPGENGLLTPADEVAYADGVRQLLQDPARLAALQAQAEADGSRYTVENMASRFADGVEHCLAGG